MKLRDILPLIQYGDDVLIQSNGNGNGTDVAMIYCDFTGHDVLSDSYLDSKVDGIQVDGGQDNRIIITIN